MKCINLLLNFVTAAKCVDYWRVDCGLFRSSQRWPVASRDRINPSVWPFSCSSTADLIFESDVQQSENKPNWFWDIMSILRSRQIRRITAGQRRCSLARCCSLSDYSSLFLMSRSTEFPLKVSPRLRELVAAYGKFFKELCIFHSDIFCTYLDEILFLLAKRAACIFCWEF